MCVNIEIASIILEICIVPEPATTSGTGLLLDRDTGGPTAIGIRHTSVTLLSLSEFTIAPLATELR